MRLAAGLIASLAFATSASANVITKCGPSKGYSYFFQNQFTKDDFGWKEDGISGGQFQLFRNGDDYDIMFTDTVGTKSAKAEGFQVMAFQQTGTDFTTVLTIHPETLVVEHFLFQLDGQGNGTAAWGSLKGGGTLIPKSAVFMSKCTQP